MQADRKKIERLLKTARGQIDGILRMVEEDRYCMDISAQVTATEAILKKVNNEVIPCPYERLPENSNPGGQWR